MSREFSRVTLSEPLWTVDEVKVHLHITGTDHDADITQKRDAAQEAILAYLGPAADVTWTAATAPKAVKHMIHILTAHYYMNRGDSQQVAGSGNNDALVWQAIYTNLGSYRDPVVK